MSAARWIAVVPFKGRGDSKSRLAVEHAERRAGLALAFLLDTVAACAAEARILLVSSDPAAADGVRALAPDALVVADPGGGLNAAIAAGLDAAGELDPEARRLVLTGDLPALDPADLRAGLRAAEAHALGVVPDRDGTGTTAVTFAPHEGGATAFGPGSFTSHRMLGFTPIELPASSTLRLDVDTAADLDAALEAGVGARTGAEVAAAAWAGSAG